MIKIKHVDKYFNENSDKEIHVIQDCNLELPDKGLISFLGSSGCGKTTLLNVIGGLDKAKGSIAFDNLILEKYDMRKFDQFRVKNIGYIFQNYLLLPEETLYDNIRISLNLIDIYDDEEIEKRVNYCLEVVGLQKYKKRKASQLSGGQQQRASIARALSKNAKIILADEPTGNLDSNNTVEIMNILKKISQTCLVLLVTHEESIAYFYSDRIIRIKDGTIIDDSLNRQDNSLEYRNEKLIYLQDLSLKEESLEQGKVKNYSDQSLTHNIEMKVVDFQGKTYIYFDDPNLILLNDKSEIKLINAKFKKITSEDIDKICYDTKFFSEGKTSNKLKNFLLDVKNAFQSVFQVKLRHKIMYLGFFFLGASFAAFSSQLSNYNYVNKKEIMNFDPSAYVFKNNLINRYGLNYLIDDPSLMFYSQVNVSLEINNSQLIQNSEKYNPINSKFNLIPFSRFDDNSKFLFGSKKKNGMVIDKWQAESILKNCRNSGCVTIEDLIGTEVYLRFKNYKITGIIDQEYNVAYINDIDLIDQSISAYNTKKVIQEESDYTIIEGRNADLTKCEGLISENSIYKVGDKTDIFGVEFTYVGRYASNDKTDELWTPRLASLVSITMAGNNPNMFPTDVQIKKMAEKEIEVINIYDYYKNEYLRNANEIPFYTTIVLIVFSSIMIIYTYFMMRTRMLSRIYTIGVYRALGARTKTVLKQFFYEIGILSIFTSFLGFILMLIFMIYLNSQLTGIMIVFKLKFFVVFITIMGMFLINFFFGLMPIYQLTRKTPAQLLTKYDI